MPLDPFLNFMADPPNWHDDPVALSCASYRHWQTSGERWARLEQFKPGQEDYDMADALRSYYRERTQDTLFRTLKSTTGQAVSDFRRKLHLISMDQLIITQAEMGMLYRLPYFYQEDLGIDCVVESTVSMVPRPVPEDGPQREIVPLTPLTKIFKTRKHSENWQFWFEGPQHEAYMLALHRDNPLLQMFDCFFEKPQVIMECKIFGRSLRYPNHWFNQIHQPTFVNV